MHDGTHFVNKKVNGVVQRVKVYGWYDLLDYNGETHTIMEWSGILHLDTNQIVYRLRKGKPLSEAKDSETVLEYKGEKKNITAWAKEKGLKRHTIAQRLRSGWTVERALDTPVIPPKERHKKK